MEESELEEGEACSYNITNDYGGSIDPDNDLSYIDEKLQNILGHFQKDFEGNFSAENLGAKFGGYGSFLPTYQRSPVWTHPKTPAKTLSSTGTTRSPNNVLGEYQSGNAASSSVLKKAKSVLGNSKKSMKTKKPNSSRQESGTKKPGVFSKQNSLKLRIKMGSESVSAEKNAAAIYSGLGLDVSPSLSLDNNNSLSGSEGGRMLNGGEPQGSYSPLLSPASIVNVMTSLPVDHLLSPLSDDLIRLGEREKPKYTSPFRFTESSNGLEPKKVEEKPLVVEKKRKTVERNSFSAETNLRKPMETAEKETANYNGAVKGEMVSDSERRSWGITRHKDKDLVPPPPPPHHENLKTSSAGSVREDKKRDDDDGSRKHNQKHSVKKESSSASKVKTVHKTEPEQQHSSRKRKSDQIEQQEPQYSSKFKEHKNEKKEVVIASKPQNDVKKPEDAYKDFFGDIGDSEEDEEEEEVKDSRIPVLEDTPEKPSFPLVTESQNVVAHKLVSDPSLPKTNPVIIQEHWVACDKCGKWRLLPFGVFPEDLPEKWMCTMLNWLPGVNYCNVPEDETTKALYAMYQIPPPDSQAPMQSNNNPKPQGDDSARKKKKGLKKIESGIDTRTIAETNKKTIQQPSLKNGSIHSELADEERQKPKPKQKEKEKGRAMDHHQQKNADQESSMLAKKMKIESFLFPEEAEHGNVRPTSSSGKPKPRVSSKEEGGGGASDTGNSDSKGGNKKRKSHGSENENRERKKARVLQDEGKLGKSEKKSRSHSKRENVQNTIAATSSSSKISDSHKHRNTSQQQQHEANNKSSPVESVSSSPMRISISNPEKSLSVRKKKEESYDDGGASDRSQTRVRDKVRGETSLEENNHKELLRKPDQSSDHHHHRRSNNESLPKKSGKSSSSSRSKDKSSIGQRHIEKDDNNPDMIVVRPNIPKPSDKEAASQPTRPPSKGIQGDSSSSMLSTRKNIDKCSTSAGGRRNEPSSSVQVANNVIKEAKDLKHTADRLKNTVSNLEHIELYFQACLKFLHGAYLLEMNSSNENANRQGETMVQSMKVYSTTASLCGFCAHEYEKLKDMGAAALAYKCMEVAYMRVVNSSYTSCNRYRNELQTSLQMVPPGESPSSSASDVDNVNHPDKLGISRGINSPLVAAGTHVITAQNRSNILRLIQFAQDVNFAMDASRKSRLAFTACIEGQGGEGEGEGIVSIRTALDFNFQDLEGFLRLVKLAMKANNR